MILLLRFWDISVSLICKLHIWRSLCMMNDISENVIYLCHYKIKWNHFKIYMSWANHTHTITSKWFRFITVKIYNILLYVIDHKLRHMCNLHIKETEISQKRSKGIKNWKMKCSEIFMDIFWGWNLPFCTFQETVG